METVTPVFPAQPACAACLPQAGQGRNPEAPSAAGSGYPKDATQLRAAHAEGALCRCLGALSGSLTTAGDFVIVSLAREQGEPAMPRPWRVGKTCCAL